MISDRPYRDERSAEAAIAELLDCAGTQFDPDVVNAFIVTLSKESEQVPALLALSA